VPCRAISAEVGLPYEAFDLTNQQALSAAVASHEAVLHIAGPFTKTGPPVVEACIEHGAHYMDITGETHFLTYVQVRPLLPSQGLHLVVIAGLCVAFSSSKGSRKLRRLFLLV
jgi:saccharopine dehydrogenase-like NADP-dependent oxidoreductase